MHPSVHHMKVVTSFEPSTINDTWHMGYRVIFDTKQYKNKWKFYIVRGIIVNVPFPLELSLEGRCSILKYYKKKIYESSWADKYSYLLHLSHL